MDQNARPIVSGNEMSFQQIRKLLEPKEKAAPEEAKVAPSLEAGALPPEIEHKGFSATGIKVIALIILVNVVAASLYYTFEWFVGKQPTVLAVMMSLVIVLSATTLPDVAILFFKKGGVNILSGLFILALGLMSSGFSMATTIGGLYDARTKSIAGLQENARADSSFRTTSAIINQNIQDAEGDIGSLSSDIKALQGEMSWLSTIENKTEQQYARSNTLQARLNKAREQYDKKRDEIKALRAQLSSLVENGNSAVIQRDDFYTFIGKRFDKGPDVMEFLFGVFPAIFIDVLGPAMLAIILFLGGNNERTIMRRKGSRLPLQKDGVQSAGWKALGALGVRSLRGAVGRLVKTQHGDKDLDQRRDSPR